MRNLVQPPPSSHCDLCHGELRLKLIESDGPALELDVEILVCAKCGHEQTYRISHNHYATHTASKKVPDKVG